MSEFTHPLVVVTACLIAMAYLALAVVITRRMLASSWPVVRVLAALAAMLATLPPILYALAAVAA
ncbi:hypothetical protein [Labedaea rhizosphaerae]|uniref:Uncharacterized protein n=1 Tax=Labedaea rhizosphaerae TaxID=598644 RepID=A0A4R6SKT9_LABRH|nr:hypothetical protein [Labedaea rhizosphaerae]TDQ05046.1 hypothetical protein EV186_1011010 [Labedaea rhizosphaerae]